MQCVAVCCSVLQCVAVCCSVLQYVAVCCSVLHCVAVSKEMQCVAMCCSIRKETWKGDLFLSSRIPKHVQHPSMPSKSSQVSPHVKRDIYIRKEPCERDLFLKSFILEPAQQVISGTSTCQKRRVYTKRTLQKRPITLPHTPLREQQIDHGMSTFQNVKRDVYIRKEPCKTDLCLLPPVP